MGSCQFEDHITISHKTTDEQAFKRAHKDAVDEHGHRSLTGTLAEKHGFKTLHRAKSKDNASRLVSHLTGGFNLPVFSEKIMNEVDNKNNPAFAIRYPIDKKTDGIVFFGFAAE